MEPSGNALSGGRDLYISLPTKPPQDSAERSAQTSSADDSSSTQTLRSAASTAATSGPINPSQSESSTRRTHQYTITASTEGKNGKVHSLDLRPEPKNHKNPVDISALPRETVTVSRKTFNAAKPHVEPVAIPSQLPDSSSAMQPRNREEYSTAMIFGTESIVSQDRTRSPARPNVSRPRYPPTSYQGPTVASNEDVVSLSQTEPPTPSLEKKGPPTELKFGKLTLEERSRAIDAPPSPHKPSGISRLVRRLSGRRKSERFTPPPSPRAPPKQVPIAAAQIARTESSPSIPLATTTYSSPDASPSPSKLIKSRRRTLNASTAPPSETAEPSSTSQPRRTTSTKLARAVSTNSPSTTTLPEPEIEYTKIHYFTHCPHTSPPSHRPLNIHPISAAFTAETLKYPPFHLRAGLGAKTATTQQANNTQQVNLPTISTIRGSCSDCDWKARRQQEGQVLATYADKRNALLRRIRSLRSELSSSDLNAARHPGDDEDENSEPDSDGNGGKLPKANPETECLEAMDLELDLLTVESEIEDLPEQQDKDVSRVWRGWAAKWGVGTIGIHRRGWVDDTSTSTRSNTGSSSPYAEEGVEAGSGAGSGAGSDSNSGVRSTLSVGAETATGTGTGTSKKPSRSVSSASRLGRGLNEWGAGSFDDVVSKGRMRLHWIRPDIPRRKFGEKKD